MVLHIHKRGRDGVSYWRCERKLELNCKGRLKTQGEECKVVSASDKHCHAPDARREEVAAARETMVERARSTQESSHLIVTSAINSRCPSAAANLPSTRSLMRIVQRERAAVQGAPANPRNLADLQLPDEFRRSLDGNDFLLFDSGSESGDLRLLMYAASDNLQQLERSEEWYADGTFKTVPHNYVFAAVNNPCKNRR